MTRSEWITVFAVLVAPLLAVQAQKWLDVIRERRHRKEFIFTFFDGHASSYRLGRTRSGIEHDRY